MIDKVNYDQRYCSLLEVYKHNSLTIASRELSLTLSAVSQQIKSIERELGVELFIRNGRQLIPTQECRLVVEYIKKIQSMCQKMSTDIGLLSKRTKHLTIGITSSVENFALAGMLEKFSAPDYPLQITVIAGTVDKICEMLDSYSIDVAIIEGGTYRDNFNELILDTDYLSVVVPPESPYLTKHTILPEELIKEPLIMKPKCSGTRRLFEAGLRSNGVSPERLNIIMEVDNTNTIIKLVSGGYGISVLSNKACAKDVLEKKIGTVPLFGIGMSRSIRAVYRRDRDCTEILGEIRRVYNEVISELSGK